MSILYIIVAILILGVIIVAHEFGHFLVGRLCGIGVVEFSVGFGPKLLSHQGKHTLFSLRAIPLGGYCKFVGEDENTSTPDAINSAPVWKRFLTVFAGPAMNFIVAFLAAIVMLCLFYVADVQPTVNLVTDGSAAQEALLQSGDVILAANGESIEQNVYGTAALRQLIQTGDALTLTVRRGEETFDVAVTPKQVETDDGTTYQLGVTFTSRTYTFGEAIPGAFRVMGNVTQQLFDALRKLIFHGEGADEMAGTVGTVVVISEVIQQDSSMVLDVLFLISLNLGIMNLLPLPALDGGRLVFLIVEAIRRKPVPPEKEGLVHLIGLGVLFLLFIVLTWHDIVTFILK